jgi:AAHS family 4-hydroxybenzoate transporter-like MFS transporter
VVAICFLVVLLDGFDTLSISFVAPVLSQEWGVPPAAFTPAFVGTSVGAVIGYLISNRVVTWFGLRRAAMAAVLTFALSTAASAFVGDIAALSLTRLVAGLGLGAILPIAIATATAAAPVRNRQLVTVIVGSGLPAGGVVGGVVGGPLIQNSGWPAVFVLGGVLPLLVLPLFVRVLPPSIAPRREEPRADGALLAAPVRTVTLLIWTFAFLVFLVTYALTFWVPTIVVELGYAPTTAPLATAAFGLGGLLGNVVMITLVRRLGVVRLLIATTTLSLLLVIALSQLPSHSGMAFPLLVALGASLITGCVGQSALAVAFYDARLRLAGVGWAAALGRVGSIVGPAAGGILLGMQGRAQGMVLAALIPGALAVVALVVVAPRLRARSEDHTGIAAATDPR